MDVIAINHYIAQVDANSKLNPFVQRLAGIGIVFGECLLCLYNGSHVIRSANL